MIVNKDLRLIYLIVLRKAKDYYPKGPCKE
jgi:hypothetical protein